MPCIRIKEMERKREEARSKKYACFDSSKYTSSVTNRCIPGGPAPSSPKLGRGNRVSVTLRNQSCQDNFSPRRTPNLWVGKSARRSGFPKLFPATTELTAPQCDDGIRAPDGPMHAGQL